MSSEASGNTFYALVVDDRANDFIYKDLVMTPDDLSRKIDALIRGQE